MDDLASHLADMPGLTEVRFMCEPGSDAGVLVFRYGYSDTCLMADARQIDGGYALASGFREAPVVEDD